VGACDAGHSRVAIGQDHPEVHGRARLRGSIAAPRHRAGDRRCSPCCADRDASAIGVAGPGRAPRLPTRPTGDTGVDG
jgi:hypothetical protein